jgi:hypothetical protein
VAACLVGCDGVLKRDSPPRVYDKERKRAYHVQCAALEAGYDEGGNATGDEGPRGVTYIELLLCD